MYEIFVNYLEGKESIDFFKFPPKYFLPGMNFVIGLNQLMDNLKAQ
jgi:hypothetical protein